MEKKIDGKSFYFGLNDAGLIECKELGVAAENFKDCFELAKKEFSEIINQARKNKGIVAIFKSWKIVEKCTVGTEDKYKVWIVREDGSRTKESKENVYVLDQSVLDEIGKVKQHIKELEKVEDEIESRLIPFYSKE